MDGPAGKPRVPRWRDRLKETSPAEKALGTLRFTLRSPHLNIPLGWLLTQCNDSSVLVGAVRVAKKLHAL
jgi:hypothetical protein